ncbi:nucleotidyltransferase domain-containing protein [Evansella cellulosilytica]|uniref:DNA polymerase beta domain protein region n=1 Tax=Evansella cellulosilytica (strain ATCC 21833 / DSM 2522 / FERM P-1141 / JCM 9156 / N-4) TaxID=649639 RepID=E6TX11_EVAC2|nr:nucleotidyltransferase domain-containing protein [Evansella cellulosilytica]ADU31100.1 DNA polymerase beta domain protein region [Evansella cellulosilytica DSM 2522]
MTKRLQPFEVAKQFIQKNFPHCHGAVLAGSVVRGEATETSDLDIVVIDMNIISQYRKSVMFLQWPIEVFVHNVQSLKHMFQDDYERATPTHQTMLAEGITIVDKGVLGPIQKEAKLILKNGPQTWTNETIKRKRYFITDALDDLIGSSNRSEEIFITNTLAYWLHEFVLRTNGHWIGDSKWIIRRLQQFDQNYSERFIEAIDDFYKYGNKHKVIALVDDTLAPYGGRLFHGFKDG